MVVVNRLVRTRVGAFGTFTLLSLHQVGVFT